VTATAGRGTVGGDGAMGGSDTVGGRGAMGGGDAARPRAALPWADRALGDLARAAHIVVAAGGHAVAYADGVELVLPAAVP
jgi:hypothetical protein